MPLLLLKRPLVAIVVTPSARAGWPADEEVSLPMGVYVRNIYAAAKPNVGRALEYWWWLEASCRGYEWKGYRSNEEPQTYVGVVQGPWSHEARLAAGLLGISEGTELGRNAVEMLRVALQDAWQAGFDAGLREKY